MSGIYNPIVFYPIAFMVILFAILTIYFKNIFYSLLSAMVVFFCVGLIFYILGSEYNAVIQIAIYGIAVPIILGLAIMFTNLKNDKEVLEQKNGFKNYGLFFLGGLFIMIFLTLISTQAFEDNLLSEINSRGVLLTFANSLFVKYVLAFELISVVLTILIVGLTLLDKNTTKKEGE